MNPPNIPNDIRFIDLPEHGSPDCMKLARGTVPAPKPTEVLIRVHGAGVNRPDVLQRLGKYPAPVGASPVLGLEVAGVVASCGNSVQRWKPGDAVCALVNGGGYAEYCVAPEGQCLPIPGGLTLTEAASLPETFFTVWANLFQIGCLRKGERALIHGGSSGIGITAIQLANAFGATVFTTAGSAEKCAFCRELGATVAVNYRTQDFEIEILALTGAPAMDVILDMVGGTYLSKNIRLLGRQGRLIQIGFLQGSRADVDFAPVLTRRLTVTGSAMRTRSAEEKAGIARELEDRVWPLLASRTVKPVIDRVFPLEQVAEAHAFMETSRHVGKIVLSLA